MKNAITTSDGVSIKDWVFRPEKYPQLTHRPKERGIFLKSIHRLRKLYQLKCVERANSVKTRKESSAEHSWSSLILADYFLNQMKNHKMDRLHVYELLMYHDVS